MAVIDYPMKFKYLKMNGKVTDRQVVPTGKGLHFGHSDYYPDMQWLLEAIDLDQMSVRIFALKNIIKYNSPDEHVPIAHLEATCCNKKVSWSEYVANHGMCNICMDKALEEANNRQET